MIIRLLEIPNLFISIVSQLWLSITSINFYKKVILSYRGYGLKYILTLSFFSSLLSSIYILNYVDNIRQYFSKGKISPAVINLDHILSQFPECKYDGTKLSLETSDPVYINNIHNQPVVLIDPGDKISLFDKTKIPILLKGKTIMFFFYNLQKGNVNKLTINYSQILGSKEQIISQEIIMSLLENFFSKGSKIIIYVIFPLLGLVIFFNTIFEKSFFILMVYLVANFMSIRLSIKTFSRLIMFASGFFVLLEPITLLISPTYVKFIWIIQIWANFLMVIAILRFANYKFF